MEWLLHDNGLRHERVKEMEISECRLSISAAFFKNADPKFNYGSIW